MNRLPTGVVVVEPDAGIHRQPFDGPLVLREHTQLRPDSSLEARVLVLPLGDLVRHAVIEAVVVRRVVIGRIVGLRPPEIADAELEGMAAGDIRDRALELTRARLNLVVGGNARVVDVRAAPVAEVRMRTDTGTIWFCSTTPIRLRYGSFGSLGQKLKMSSSW